jgi:hypothetical protein
MNERQHYERSEIVAASSEDVFDFVDDHAKFSAHMGKSSGMMAGGRMDIEMDERRGRAVGSHIRMRGSILGVEIFLDEVVTVHDRPSRKEWETVGSPHLIVVGCYKMGVHLTSHVGGTLVQVFIDYELPSGVVTHELGRLFGKCLREMVCRSDARRSSPALLSVISQRRLRWEQQSSGLSSGATRRSGWLRLLRVRQERKVEQLLFAIRSELEA